MSQKKKLIIGPLPEQADDYSHYEETVTRWDRIIAVLVVIAIVLAVIIYSVVDGDSQKTELQNSQADVGLNQDVNNKLNAPNISAPSVLDQKGEEKSGSKPIKIASQPESIEEGNSKNLVEQDIQIVSSQGGEVEEDELPSTHESGDVQDVNPAIVNILNAAISRSVLTLEIKDKEPVSSLPYDVNMSEEGIIKVILFTEMNGLRGKTLYHEWYRNGVRQAKVKIPVNVSKQRSHSSKYINAQMLGEWQVKVVDEKSAPYVLANFRVVNH